MEPPYQSRRSCLRKPDLTGLPGQRPQRLSRRPLTQTKVIQGIAAPGDRQRPDATGGSPDRSGRRSNSRVTEELQAELWRCGPGKRLSRSSTAARRVAAGRPRETLNISWSLTVAAQRDSQGGGPRAKLAAGWYEPLEDYLHEGARDRLFAEVDEARGAWRTDGATLS